MCGGESGVKGGGMEGEGEEGEKMGVRVGECGRKQDGGRG